MFTLELNGLKSSNFQESAVTQNDFYGQIRTKVRKFIYAFNCSVHETECAHQTESELLLPSTNTGAVTVVVSAYDTHQDVHGLEDFLGKIETRFGSSGNATLKPDNVCRPFDIGANIEVPSGRQ